MTSGRTVETRVKGQEKTRRAWVRPAISRIAGGEARNSFSLGGTDGQFTTS